MFHVRNLGVSCFSSLRNACLLQRTGPCITDSKFISVRKKSVEESLGLSPKPKKPLSPFFRYYIEMNPLVREQFPEIRACDVVKKIGELWNNCSNDVKTKYEQEYNKDYLEYLKKMAFYNNTLSDEHKKAIQDAKKLRKEERKERLLKKKCKEMNKPKRPPNPYSLFVREQMKTLGPDIPQKERISKVSKEWRNMSDSQKQIYIEMASKEHAEYLKNIEQWEHEMITQGHTDVDAIPFNLPCSVGVTNRMLQCASFSTSAVKEMCARKKRTGLPDFSYEKKKKEPKVSSVSAEVSQSSDFQNSNKEDIDPMTAIYILCALSFLPVIGLGFRYVKDWLSEHEEDE